MLLPVPPRASRRAFTLIELLVVILVLGILAAIATVGYTLVTDRAHSARAQANLHSIAMLTIAAATADDAPELTRAAMTAAIEQGANVSVVPGLSGSQTWHLGGSTDVPVVADDYAVAFDNNNKIIDEDHGTRAVVTTSAGEHAYARIITWRSDATAGADGGPNGGPAGQVPPGTTPEDVLKNPALITTPGTKAPTPNPGGGATGDLGNMTGTLTAYNDAWEGYEQADFNLTGVPEGASTGDMICTVDKPWPLDAVVDAGAYEDVPGKWVGYWGSWPTAMPDEGREYTCTVRVFDADGAVLARLTLATTVGGAPTTNDARPAAPSAKNIKLSIPATKVVTATWDPLADAVGESKITAYDGGTDTATDWCYTATPATGCQMQMNRFSDGATYDFAVTTTFAPGPYLTTSSVSPRISATMPGMPAGAHAALSTTAFGDDVDISGDTMIAGDSTTTGTGTAGVFIRNGTDWQLQATLSVPGANRNFGSTVAISGNTAVVGASTWSGATGGVYVFTRTGTTWGSGKDITPATLAANDMVNLVVDADGSTVVIGAPMSPNGPGLWGAVYVLTGTGQTWSQAARIEATREKGTRVFGASVDLDGTTLAVGAPDQSLYGSTGGGTYMFSGSGPTWDETALLVAPADDAQVSLGRSVSLDGDTLVVGAPFTDGSLTSPGAAFVFDRSGGTWNAAPSQKLVASDPTADQQFGKTVAISGDKILVGGPSENAGAYLFTKSAGTWGTAQRIAPSYSYRFGYAVAADGGKFAIGSAGYSGLYVYDPAGN